MLEDAFNAAVFAIALVLAFPAIKPRLEYITFSENGFDSLWLIRKGGVVSRVKTLCVITVRVGPMIYPTLIPTV
jgi:hypothetical protein